LLQLVNERFVEGWDDPRMPTISGMRRRGYTPESIRDFCNRIGIGKRDNTTEASLLEFCVREHLNKIALRRMVVFDPVKLVITNYPAGQPDEMVETENNPEDEKAGTREMPFSGEIYIEREDFMENPPKKYFRLAPGQMVRLKSAYIIRCDEVVKNDKGEVSEIRCSYIPESRSGADTSGINVKGTLHWVSVKTAVSVEIKEYDRLFKAEDPTAAGGEFTDHINPNSLRIVNTAVAEPALANAKFEERYQFLRKGYFTLDKDSSPSQVIFNRTVTLKDSWAKKS
jgi:glutaminyl-tRNA synthetase